MKKIIIFLYTLLIFTGCSNNPEFSFEENIYQEILLEDCLEDDCTEIEIITTEITQPINDVTSKINQNNLSLINDILSFDDDTENIDSYQAITMSFINAYADLAKKTTIPPLPWKGNASNTVTFYNTHLISFAIEYYTFIGGAHGHKGERAVHYNPNTGEKYRSQELFKDWKGFSLLVQSKLNEHYDQQRLDRNLFDNEEFSMPNNIFVYEDSIIAYYNSYDISAFTDTAISLTFTLEEVSPYLQHTLFSEISTTNNQLRSKK